MDIKNLPDLDPKLKEAYERVMGTSLATPIPRPPQSTPIEPSSGPGQNSNTQPQTAQFPSPTHKSSSLLPILIFLLGTIFFIAYTLFWITLFNIELPITF